MGHELKGSCRNFSLAKGRVEGRASDNSDGGDCSAGGNSDDGNGNAAMERCSPHVKLDSATGLRELYPIRQSNPCCETASSQ